MNDAPKASIRYFTGTGNSKRVADICAAALAEGGYATDVGAITAGGPSDGDAACFVFPVYSLDLPRIAKRYLEALPPTAGSVPRPTLLLVTGGDPDDCGWSLIEGSRLLASRGFDVSFADLVRMPNNWGPFMKVPDREEAKAILETGEAEAKEATLSFLAGRRYAKALSLAKFGPLGSRLMRAGFALGVKRLWSRFKVSAACTSCGLCARSCPTGSIVMEGGRPRWSAGCEQCMRCFNLCPSRAILQLEAIGRGSTRERWIEPHFKP